MPNSSSDIYLIGRTVEMESRTLVEAARAGPETHGEYMTDCKVSEVSKWARSDEGAKAQLREFTESRVLSWKEVLLEKKRGSASGNH
jgi:hypothetical protein